MDSMQWEASLPLFLGGMRDSYEACEITGEARFIPSWVGFFMEQFGDKGARHEIGYF